MILLVHCYCNMQNMHIQNVLEKRFKILNTFTKLIKNVEIIRKIYFLEIVRLIFIETIFFCFCIPTQFLDLYL